MARGVAKGLGGDRAYKRGARGRRGLWFVRSALRGSSGVLLGGLDAATPKRPRRLVFGCDKGLKYNGNPRALFEHLADDPAWDVYWLTADPAVRDEMEPRFRARVVSAWSPKGLWLGLTSRWLCVSHSKYDLGPFASLDRPRFLYLNHGTPLKTMGYAKAYEDPGVAAQSRSFGAITCCSPFEAELWERAFRVGRDRIWVTGVPRNDKLFRPDPEIAERLQLDRRGKVVLFAPTYRETGVLEDYLPTPDVDGRALVELLERHDATLLVRPHYYEWDAARKTIERLNSDRVIAADEGVAPDVNDLLPFVDVLITDYSSIYVDYLLLDRPCIFSPYDREAYAETRGFMIDYDAHTPGRKVTVGAELLDALDAELSGADPCRDERARLRALFHTFPDGHSASRVASRIAAE